MKRGFQIEIQKDLNPDELSSAESFAKSFIINTLKDPAMKYNGENCKGGWESYYKRGTLGKLLGGCLVFRRVSKNRRVFGVVRLNELVRIDDNLIPSEKLCRCPVCSGSIPVKWKNKKPETFIYCKVGEIKG